MSLKHASDVEVKNVSDAKGTTIQNLISLAEGLNFALNRFSVQKGGGTTPHINTVEHEQYILRGSATITIGGETVYAKKDDMVFIPEGAMHSYHNTGEEPFEFLCIVPNANRLSLQT